MYGCRFRVQAPARAPAAARRRPTATAMQTLLAEFPWLAEDLAPRRVVRRRPGVLHDDSDVEGAEPPPLHDVEPAALLAVEGEPLADLDSDHEEDHIVADVDVAAALHEARENLDPEDREGSFYVQWLGGAWTLEHTGEAYDRISVQGRANRPTEFCKKFHWPASRSYSKNKYHGAENVVMLGHGFCQRSRYFYGIWAASGFDPDFTFGGHAYPAYVESEAFLDWAVELGLEDACFEAVVRDRAVVPHP